MDYTRGKAVSIDNLFNGLDITVSSFNGDVVGNSTDKLNFYISKAKIRNNGVVRGVYMGNNTKAFLGALKDVTYSAKDNAFYIDGAKTNTLSLLAIVRSNRGVLIKGML